MRRPARPRRSVPILAFLLSLALLATACGLGGDAAADEDGSAETETSADDGAEDEAAASAPDVEPYTLRIGVVASDSERIGGVLGWAEENGSLLEGLALVGVESIELLRFGTGPPLVAALENGDVDLISTGDVPALVATGNGLDARLVQLAAVNSDTWLVGQPDGPTEIADLVGHTVTAPPGTAPERVVIGLLEEAGVADQIDVTNLATPDAINALHGGQVDAIPVVGLNASRLEDQGFTILGRARDTETLGGTSTIVGREGFLDDHPGLATAFRASFAAAAQEIRDDFDAYLAWQAEVEGESVELTSAVYHADQFPLEAVPNDAVPLLEATAQYALDTGAIDEPFDVEAWFYDE